ncbi:tetratricopeptide repeat protein [Rhizobium laguerreae]|uniref:tetratricopeptide repeat protein n=1 Tax=Rhizobium laguerreae TaxID=1076926 RepID=UPI0013F14CDE|nr:tetratricopeptide repeat protein [Rhizobium laguerreae]
MNAGQHETEICRVSNSRAGAELERLFSDTRFHPTDRQKAIINYLAARRFAGCEEPVKAYSIGIDVLGKTSSFDPAQDPIVRIEMSRLRSLLEDHYEAFGHQTETWIEIPRGRYVAQFTTHQVPTAPPQQISVKGVATSTSTSMNDATPMDDPYLTRPRFMATAAAAVLCLSAGIGGLTWLYNAPASIDVPTVSIGFGSVDPLLGGDASLTRDILLTALAQFRTLAVVLGPAQARSTPDYRVEIKYYGSENDRTGRWQIVDAQSGHLLDAGVENVAADGRSLPVVRGELASALASRLGSTKGTISLNEARRSPSGAIGNVCTLRAEAARDDLDPAELAAATRCLKRTISARPEDASALAALSSILLVENDRASLAASSDLADQAVAADPLSERAHLAMARALFAAGKLDAAITSANRALALNPNNPDVYGTLATLLFSGGYWKAAADMADDAGRFPDLVPREALLVKALVAYREREWSDALLIAEQVPRADVMGNVLRIASLAQIEAQGAEQLLEELQAQVPGIASSFRSMIISARYRPEVAASIEDGLRKAGARLESAARRPPNNPGHRVATAVPYTQ